MTIATVEAAHRRGDPALEWRCRAHGMAYRVAVSFDAQAYFARWPNVRVDCPTCETPMATFQNGRQALPWDDDEGAHQHG